MHEDEQGWTYQFSLQPSHLCIFLIRTAICVICHDGWIVSRSETQNDAQGIPSTEEHVDCKKWTQRRVEVGPPSEQV